MASSASSLTTDRLILILGSGPGIGVGVASYFGARGFSKVALVSRNAERLKEDAASVSRAATKGAEGEDDQTARTVEVKTYSADLGGDAAALRAVLGRVEEELGKPEVVVYNASRLARSEFGKYAEKDVVVDLQISTVSLYTVALWALPHLVSLAADSSRKPSFLVTSGGLYKTPFSPYFSLSLSKAAQHNLTMSLNQAYTGKGVHVAAVVVHGLVTPESKHFPPSRVAEVFWKLYEQDAKEGEKEVWITAPEEDETSAKWKARAHEELKAMAAGH